MVWFWLGLRMLAIGVGAYCGSRPKEAYADLSSAMPSFVPENVYSFLGDDESRYMAIAGYSLAALAILLGYVQERASAKSAVQSEAETLYWLDELQRRAGPAIGTIVRAADKPLELRNFHDSLLTAALRVWGGKGNRHDVRLAYFRATGAGDTVELEPMVMAPAGAKAEIARVRIAGDYMSRRRRFGRFWGPAGQFNAFARKSVVQIVVRSPLDPQRGIVGVVVGDSPKRTTFKGEPRRVGALCLASWLGAGEVAARPELQDPTGSL